MRSAAKVMVLAFLITFVLSLAVVTGSGGAAAGAGREGEGDLSTAVPALDAAAYDDGVYTQDEVAAMQQAATGTLPACPDDSGTEDGTACYWDASEGETNSTGRDFIYFNGEFFYSEGN